MRWFRASAFAGLLIGVAGVAHAAVPGFAFLDIPTSARAAALGGAYTSMAIGTEAVFWNAAGLTGMHSLEVSGGHSELIESLRHDYFSVGGPLWGGGVATSIRALYSESIDERDDLGNLIGTFGSHDLEFALGYGHTVGGGVSFGGTVSAIRERISSLAATTYAFGAGASWEPARVPGARIAVAAQNMGPPANYTIDGIPGQDVGLPAAVQAGVSYTTNVGERVTVRGAAESRVTRGRNAVGIMGAELAGMSGASLRIGMRVNDPSTALSVGAGYTMSALRLDYAFVPMRLDLGDTHRIAFTARF